ncbi:MAG TPA: hypothetical protein VFL55_21575 [Acetobacteraceae bacterium]|nr:hypothetical protein [Acetobacteraceae bacterium]
MKLFFLKPLLAAVVLGCFSHAAFADASNDSAAGSNGNGPAALNTPFTIWADESAKGKKFTPMNTMMQQAHRNSTASPTSVAQKALP